MDKAYVAGALEGYMAKRADDNWQKELQDSVAAEKQRQGGDFKPLPPGDPDMPPMNPAQKQEDEDIRAGMINQAQEAKRREAVQGPQQQQQPQQQQPQQQPAPPPARPQRPQQPAAPPPPSLSQQPPPAPRFGTNSVYARTGQV